MNARRWEGTAGPVVLRLGLVALFVVAQAGTPPGLGLTERGPGYLVLTFLVAMAVTGTATASLSRRNGRSWPAPFGVPLAVVLTGCAIALSIGLLAFAYTPLAVSALLYLVGVAAVRHPLRYSLPLALIAIAGLLWRSVETLQVAHELGLCVSTCLVFLIAYSVRQRRQARSAEAREAVLAERARIAREIHDILAHSLSAQIVHLEGARLLLRADRAQEALDRVDRARDLAKSGLEEARRAVAALRGDVPPLTEALKALAEEFRIATGHDCEVVVDGVERGLSPETALAVFRTAQEAVTNVGRHAPGAPATVRLTFLDGGCELEVGNPAGDSPETPAEGSGGGYGLVGMRERAELLGGTLEAGPSGRGFRVRLWVPA
ncbi:hypothetical protein JOL79_13280 [Microbispora sp. RL4-1S]|uniref:histidine kinase n=1 Tax=Microbispora oryzae TaxID=2806554 RepID=A0A941AI53_9ACTN|nr:histidine kinase [Microbispora oryzae]MBP2704786.1 hypothetical protein [Microbispora oryzae]